jgi:uncharacterized protein with GYD domain
MRGAFGLFGNGDLPIAQGDPATRPIGRRHSDVGYWPGKVKEFYSMMGQYDSMFIVEAPNDDVMAQLSLTVGAQGNVRTETHRAFNEEEYRKIVKNIP